MSERRKVDDRAWIVPGAGFNASKGEWGTILDCASNQPDELFPCCLNCGDDFCMEWNDVKLESGLMAYHVSECEMLDEPLKENSESDFDKAMDYIFKKNDELYRRLAESEKRDSLESGGPIL